MCGDVRGKDKVGACICHSTDEFCSIGGCSSEEPGVCWIVPVDLVLVEQLVYCIMLLAIVVDVVNSHLPPSCH